MKIITYDLEIRRAILNGMLPDVFEEQYPGIEYCSTFQDFDKMGVACVCALKNYGNGLPLIYDRHKAQTGLF